MNARVQISNTKARKYLFYSPLTKSLDFFQGFFYQEMKVNIVNKNDKRVKYACYTTNLSMSVVSNVSPILFLTFRELYGISYSLLGLLVLINFSTQLIIDFLFSFFSYKINMRAAVKTIPLLTTSGLLLFAGAPLLFPNNVYVGLVLGTVIFSAAGGFVEVLISPVIAALPAENPEREMSKLHSVYAWGTVGVILISTAFILLFGAENWQWLALFFIIVPVISFIFFFTSTLPELEKPERASGVVALLKSPTLWLCFTAIFLGGAAECTMSQWSSSYLELALGIPKIWGDIFGVALFAMMLGLGRTLYSKYGKNIEKVLLVGAMGASVCYIAAALSPFPVIGLVACALTGFCVSMLWPGSVIVGSERVPAGGVFIYAMMAAGGDLGASVAPQLVGVITDTVAVSPAAQKMAEALSLSPDQLGMKLGMLIGALFPILAVFVYLYILKTKHRKNGVLE